MSTGSGLWVLAPLRMEARAVAAGAPGATVHRSGMGLARSAETVRRLLGGTPTAVAVAGVAGALVEGLRPGDLVVPDVVLDSTGAEAGRPAAAAVVTAALRRAGLTVRVGPIISTTRMVKGREGRAALAAFGAIAVDMESSAFQGGNWNAPMVVIRAISDTPGQELVSPATLVNGRRALDALRNAGPVLESWAAAVAPRAVVVAGPRASCAGVRRAVEVVERALDRFGPPVYVRRQIVHNRHVVAELEGRGARFVQELEEVPDGATVVFSAHGVSPAVRQEAAGRQLAVIDATCPLVAKVHTEVRRFRDRGYPVVLIGHRGHDETEGTIGEAAGIQLVEKPQDVEHVSAPADGRVAYVTQTTLAPDETSEVVSALRDRFADLIGPHSSDICYATQNRQDAVRAVASEVDLMLVIGSVNSSNTARLAEVATRAGCQAELLDDETELQLDWFRGVERVGVSAGASAPESLVIRVVAALGGLGCHTVEYRTVREESVVFPLPVEVR